MGSPTVQNLLTHFLLREDYFPLTPNPSIPSSLGERLGGGQNPALPLTDYFTSLTARRGRLSPLVAFGPRSLVKKAQGADFSPQV